MDSTAPGSSGCSTGHVMFARTVSRTPCLHLCAGLDGPTRVPHGIGPCCQSRYHAPASLGATTLIKSFISEVKNRNRHQIAVLFSKKNAPSDLGTVACCKCVNR